MGHRKERLPLRIKAQVPEGALALQDKLAETQYPPIIVCPVGHRLSLQEDRPEWKVGTHVFYLGPIPSYRDEECGIIYLSTQVVNGIVSGVNEGLARLGEKENFRLPRNFQSIG